MAKEVVKKIKLQIPAGKATPAPPVGTALGPTGINIGEFVTKFNDATKDKMGDIIPVDLTIFADRTFEFTLKTPPASRLILKKLGIEKGSGTNLTKKAGKLSKQQVKEIAEEKIPDLNTNDVEEASKIIEGTARSMGIEVS
jgi:large subunit ribosomal protein L11